MLQIFGNHRLRRSSLVFLSIVMNLWSNVERSYGRPYDANSFLSTCLTFLQLLKNIVIILNQKIIYTYITGNTTIR